MKKAPRELDPEGPWIFDNIVQLTQESGGILQQQAMCIQHICIINPQTVEVEDLITNVLFVVFMRVKKKRPGVRVYIGP
jgi:hypothetical protein